MAELENVKMQILHASDAFHKAKVNSYIQLKEPIIWTKWRSKFLIQLAVIPGLQSLLLGELPRNLIDLQLFRTTSIMMAKAKSLFDMHQNLITAMGNFLCSTLTHVVANITSASDLIDSVPAGDFREMWKLLEQHYGDQKFQIANQLLKSWNQLHLKATDTIPAFIMNLDSLAMNLAQVVKLKDVNDMVVKLQENIKDPALLHHLTLF